MTLAIMANLNSLTTYDKLAEFFQAKGIHTPLLEECEFEQVSFTNSGGPELLQHHDVHADVGNDKGIHQKMNVENDTAKSKPLKKSKPRKKIKKNEK